MKRKLSKAQGMVEYALLLTMVAVPMIVIYATLGDAAGLVWQSVIDGLSDTEMFEVHDYTLNGTHTAIANTRAAEEAASTSVSTTAVPTITNTVDPFGPPTETPVDTEIPTATEVPPTATHFVPATYTPIPPTEAPTETPVDTATPENTATTIPTPTPVYVSVTDVGSYWQGDSVYIEIHIDSVKEKVLVLNTSSGARINVICSWYCTAMFTDTTHSGGYVNITTKEGDDINYFYPARTW